MTIRVIAPHISCVVTAPIVDEKGETEFVQAINQGYSEIYIVAPNGLFKYHKLRPGKDGASRSIQIPVDKLPNGDKFMQLGEKVSFLPDGKIPMSLLDEVRAFFRKVIEKKGRALEAMIWILWNQEQGYHLFVPSQNVGHASASYDWSGVPAGSSIIVDIHSHADFNAFFSGTDNADDRNCIRYSMVIGHNDKPGLQAVLRFNYFDKKIETQITDVFTETVTEVGVPEEWLDKVNSVQTPPSFPVTRYNGGNYQGYQGYQGYTSYKGHTTIPPEVGSRKTPPHGNKWSASKAVSSAVEAIESRSSIVGGDQAALGKSVTEGSTNPPLTRIQKVAGKANAANVTPQKDVAVDPEVSKRVAETYGFESDFSGFGFSPDQIPGDWALPDGEGQGSKKAVTGSSNEFIPVDSDEKIERALQRMDNMDPFRDISSSDDEPVSHATGSYVDVVDDDDGLFDAMVISYGPVTAKAYVSIMEHLPQIKEEAVLAGNMIADLFLGLSSETQLSLFKNLFESLDDRSQEKIQMNGL